MTITNEEPTVDPQEVDLLAQENATPTEGDGEGAPSDDSTESKPDDAAPTDGEKGEATEQTEDDQDPKPEGDSPKDEGQDDSDGDGGDSPLGAPESYEFTTPEGTVLGEHINDAFTEVARELDLSNAAAQKILDSMGPAIQKQNTEAINSTLTGWINESQKKFGDGFKDVKAQAQKALALAPPELRKLLGPVKDGGTGLGNHWSVIQTFATLAEHLREDTDVVTSDGGDPKPAKKSIAERMFG